MLQSRVEFAQLPSRVSCYLHYRAGVFFHGKTLLTRIPVCIEPQLGPVSILMSKLWRVAISKHCSTVVQNRCIWSAQVAFTSSKFVTLYYTTVGSWLGIQWSSSASAVRGLLKTFNKTFYVLSNTLWKSTSRSLQMLVCLRWKCVNVVNNDNHAV